MKRQQKYPETSTFHYFNANPKNRITGDCRIRAISEATGVPYNQVVMDLARIQCETGYDQTANQGISILMKEYGWIKCKQPRKTDNTKYTGKEFCKYIDRIYNDRVGNVFCSIGTHHDVCIKKHEGNYKVWDTWDSTDGCIGNFWLKKLS